MVVIGWRAMYVAHVPDRHFRTPPLPCSPVGPTCRCCCRCSTAMPSDSSSKAWDQLAWRYDLLRSGDDHGIVMPLFRILRHLPPLRMRPLTPRHKEQNHRGYLVWRLLSQELPVVGELMNLVRMQGRLPSLQLLAEASNIQVGHNSIAGLAANVSRSSQIARNQSDAQTMSLGNAAFRRSRRRGRQRLPLVVDRRCQSGSACRQPPSASAGSRTRCAV